MIVSASALVRHCGHQRLLNRQRPKPASTQVACDRGVTFHKAVEEWVETWTLPQVADLEIQGWLDLLAASGLTLRTSMETEVAWGLSPEGGYLGVTEPAPHVYEAATPLLTAGRADLAFEHRDCVTVIDWKTGKYPATPAVDNLQVNAACIALAQRTGALSFRPVVYYARDGAWDRGPVVTMGSPEHARIFVEIKTAALLDETPRPGEHCATCWERKGCASAQSQ